MENFTHRIISIGLWISLIYLLILQVYAIWPFTIDDMYITLRYAKHWTEGYGLVWNVNEPPVEGYSNFSYVLLGSLALLLHLDPVTILKSLGVLGLWATSIAVYLIARIWFKPRLAIIPCIWLLLYRGEIIWSVSGLETTVYQALICFSVYFILKSIGNTSQTKVLHTSYLSIASLCLFLASLTRPEAPILMVMFVLLIWLNCTPIQRRSCWQPLLLFIGLYCICYLPYFLWRWHYYGQLFPNPVYCKGLSPSDNFVLVNSYLSLIWPFILLSIVACWKTRDKRHYFLWMPSLVYALLLFGADPIVAFDNRLLLPAFALLLPLALQGITRLTHYFLGRKDVVFDMTTYIVAGLIAFFCVPMLSFTAYQQFTKNSLAGEQIRKRVFVWLKQHAKKQSSIVLADSGLIPYLSPLTFIDSYCLNNKNMAQQSRKLMFEHFCQNIFKVKPDVIILTSLIEKGRVIYTPADVCLAKELPHQNYRIRATFQAINKSSIYRYEVYGMCTK
jgi:hypothetical protein